MPGAAKFKETELIALYLIKLRIIFLTRTDLCSAPSKEGFASIFHNFPSLASAKGRRTIPGFVITLPLCGFCHHHRRYHHQHRCRHPSVGQKPTVDTFRGTSGTRDARFRGPRFFLLREKYAHIVTSIVFFPRKTVAEESRAFVEITSQRERRV